MDWSMTLQPLIVLIVPVLVSQMKKAVPAGHEWVIPTVLAPIAALALNVVGHYAAGASVSTTTAIVLGIAGVGLREIADQLKQKVTRRWVA